MASVTFAPAGATTPSTEFLFIYKSPRYFIPSFESDGFLVQEKECKIDFQDGGHGDKLGFPTGTILAIFDLLIVPMPKLSFKSIYSTGWEELLKMWKAKGRMDDGQQAMA